MISLRTISTARLAAICASATAVAAGGTAIAVAGDDGPKPPPKPLAAAVHDALTAPATPGITARVKFTNHLIDTSGVQGRNPLLSGATGRLWVSPGKGLRLELQSDGGDAQLVATRGSFWLYDGSANTVYRGRVPAHRGERRGRERSQRVPSVARIERGLARLGKRVEVSGAEPGNVGGQPAYTLRVGPPRKPGGLLGAAELAWDAARGVPLRAAVYARGSSQPVIELSATDVSYGPVADSTYAVEPPAGAKSVDVMPRAGRGGHRGHAALRGGRGLRGEGRRGHGGHRLVHGRAAVARRLPFPLSAPDALAGRTRSGVKLLRLGGGPSALVTYGEGPGAVAVLERAERPGKQRSGDREHSVKLPAVTIGDVSGELLETPLGSMVRFTRARVSYTVLGSVPAAVAEAAARGL